MRRNTASPKLGSKARLGPHFRAFVDEPRLFYGLQQERDPVLTKGATVCVGVSGKKNRLKTDLKERARNNKNKNECILFCCTNTPTISEIESNLNLN